MTPEQDAPILSIEHWNYQMAKDAGHPEIGEMGMFIDVAVLKRDGEIVKVQKIKELKIHWERFKRDEAYAGEMLVSAEKLIGGREASARVLIVFSSWRGNFHNFRADEDMAIRLALDQTLYASGLNDAQIKLGDLDRETSGRIARALIEVSGPRLREIVEEFGKADAGDTLDTLNFSDPRAKRILAAARRLFPQEPKKP